MRGATSGPTMRTLDVLELLARSPTVPMRYVDIVRELNLNPGTAHSILKTLVDRGWVSRDPIEKTFSLGPAAAVVGALADKARPLLHAARETAQRLADELGFAASVVERQNDELVISASFSGNHAESAPAPGTRVPYAPPFGAIFATFASESERLEWLARIPSKDRKVSKALERSLDVARERGYDIDWTTPSVSKLMAMTESMTDLHPSLLAAMDKILLELTALTFDDAATDQPVTSIIAPVSDARGHTQLAIAIHPLRPLSARKIKSCANRLVMEARKLSV